MEILSVKTVSQKYAARKDIARIIGYKNPSDLLKRFREYADANPKAFHPYKPYIKHGGMDTLYSVICFAYFFEYKDLIEAGSRSISFKKELSRLKEIYG